MKKFLVLFFIFFSYSIIFSAVLGFFSTVTADELGSDSSLSFWNVAYRSNVMFGNLLDEEGKCLGAETGSVYTLNAAFLPPDAYVMKALLVWTGAQPVDKVDEITDREVLLSFKSEDGKIEETETVTASGYKVSEPQGFEFDSFIDGDSGKAYFTYRVDVTDFFKTIHEKGREFGNYYDGESLYGDYTVSGFDCSDDEIYLENNRNVSNWAIVLVYASYSFSRSSIVFFDGLYGYEPGSKIDLEGPVCPTNDFEEPSCTMLSNHGVDLFYDDNHEILKWTLTNLLISHEDTPSSNFDIPDQPELVACTPANIPVDPDNPDSSWCETGEHTFAIRIQNRGDSDAENIVVKAEIPEYMKYVPGSTQYADEFCIYQNKKHAEIFRNISENENGFPLADGFNITELTGKLDPCPEDSDYLSCENMIIIRFRAKVRDSIQKHTVIESSAIIDTYNSNQGIPLKLRYGSECERDYDYDESDCGGYPNICNPFEYSDAETRNDNDSENIDTETIPDSDDKDLINDSDTETDERNNYSGCGCSLIY